MDKRNNNPPVRTAARDDRGVAIALAVSILICLATFIWIFVEIEPFMHDFTGSDVVVTPVSDDPLAIPDDGTTTP